MSVAKFKVKATFDGSGGKKDGTVEIDRATGNVVVRPKGSRTTFHVGLDVLATWACRVGAPVKSTNAGGDQDDND